MKYLFLLIPFLSFGQKSVQLTEYLGETKILDTPESGTVHFVFQKITLPRETDGSQTYIDLLKNSPGFRDDMRAGKLVAVKNNGRTIPRLTVTRYESAIPMGGDSLDYFERLESLKKQGTIWESRLWIYLRPTWETVMHFFWLLWGFILLIAGILWFWTKFSAAEELPDIHYKASKALTYLIGSVFSIFLVNCFMGIVSMEYGLLGFSLSMIVLFWVAFAIAQALVKNYKQKPNGRPTQQTFNNNRLNG